VRNLRHELVHELAHALVAAEGDRDDLTLNYAQEELVDEELPDERLVIRADTSAAAIRRRAGLEEISADDFAEHFGQAGSGATAATVGSICSSRSRRTSASSVCAPAGAGSC
jgi:hypothetical protein